MDELLLHQVQQSTGSGYENIYSVPQGFDLMELVDASENHGVSKAKKAPISLDAIPNLGCKFPGWGENECSRRTFPRTIGVTRKLLEEWQGEGSGFAGACLSGAQ
jgi:hypothetical protein|tara:strand:+ start:837 stop:1151 length:315 start_codon:yes stop_codon:yes gene_type:complete